MSAYAEHLRLLTGEPAPRLEEGPGLMDWPGPDGDTDAPSARGALPMPVRLLDAPPAEPPSWLVEGLLLAGEPTLIAGQGGSYKSTTALAIAAAVAGGYAAFGAFEAAAAGEAVLIVSEEDAQAVIQDRLEALIRGMEWDRTRVLANVFLLALEGCRLDDLSWQLHLRAQGERLGAALFVFDPLADLLSRSENSTDDARAVVAFWRTLAREGAAVLVTHHVGKPKEGYAEADRVRGAGAWANAARCVYVTTSSAPGEVQLSCVKSNRVPRGEPIALAVDVVADPVNPASWISARITAPGRGGDWRVRDRSVLTAAERRVLEALERAHPEVLSWSRLAEEADVSKAMLSKAKAKLEGLGYLRREEAGHRAGRVTFCYGITDSGRLALIPEAPGSRVQGGFTSGFSEPAPAPSSRVHPPTGGGEPVNSIRAGFAAPEFTCEPGTEAASDAG